jgi:DNA-binding GntR family transcriptional regulator
MEAVGIRSTVPNLGGRESRLLVELLDGMERQAGRSEPASLARADRAFHLGLVSGGSLRVRRLAEELAGSVEAHSRAHFADAAAREASLREHRQILASVLERDTEECVTHVVAHHLRAVTALVAEISPGHPLDRVRIAALQATGHHVSALDVA